ncbi:adapter molecule Crk-like isoform X1 [Anastrepha obliqua]|uniref:adapter molecule Crk-like isoform X1 n=2 Tax=Anastrepha obliqua TaxID=95512 RepID=UPI002409D3D1|nr:adapter molecule Crk-like isoform X1 [Anastrepha obliqua]XP_054745432.1 adapter molecule Crk-like isoform X1 [Anastrepha obliqua]
MDTFDVSNRNSWYFGTMSRQDATEVLMNERDRGVFLVRDSNSIAGDYVLCVREDTKVSNYIINKIQQQDQIFYRIGDQLFENLPKLLTFYTLHYLDTTPLRRPASKKPEKVVGKFDFDGSDQDDLPFRRGEILTVIRKDEDQWWTAKNQQGQIGQIPVPYVQRCEENTDDNCIDRPLSSISNCGNPLGPSNSLRSPLLANATCKSDATESLITANCHQLSNSLKKSDLHRKLPAYARVKQARVPNAYDKTALKLEIDDVIKVTKTNINGQWEGELKGKKGHFPFTHVEFIDDCEPLHSPESNTTEAHSVQSTKNDWGE